MGADVECVSASVAMQKEESEKMALDIQAGLRDVRLTLPELSSRTHRLLMKKSDR